MKTPFYSIFFTFCTSTLFFGYEVYAVPWDHSFNPGCIAKPDPPLYKGGIVVNPEMNEDLKGYKALGNAKIASAQSPDGNKYAVASGIAKDQLDGIAQILNVEKDILYSFSAWFQASKDVTIQANVVASSGNVIAGVTLARKGCWSMLKGGFSLNLTEPVELRFETNSAVAEFWLASLSVQPFTQAEWTAHQTETLEKVRKAKMKFEAVDESGKPVAGAAVSIKQRLPHFPFGNAMNSLIIQNKAYQKWFLEKGFKYTVFENELKWEFNEKKEGTEDYTDPDAMLTFCKSNNISVRGHNILWDDPKFVRHMKWLDAKNDEDKKVAAMKRVNSVVARYKGQLIHWDVINENIHYDLFSRLTSNGVEVFKLVHELDPSPILFINEYNVIETVNIHSQVPPFKLLNKINQIRSGGFDGPMGIGLQSHFDAGAPNYAYVRASIDMFATTGLPIWITEFDIDSKMGIMLPFLEPILRELYSHAAVNGIVMWGSLGTNNTFFKMALTDNAYKNTKEGDAVDKFMKEYIRVADTTGKTDAKGIFEASLFHGEYEATVTPSGGAPVSQTFNLLPNGDVTALQFKLKKTSHPEL